MRLKPFTLKQVRFSAHARLPTGKCLLPVCISHLPVGMSQIQAVKSLLQVWICHLPTGKCLLLV
jgi:hypothetical protein